LGNEFIEAFIQQTIHGAVEILEEEYQNGRQRRLDYLNHQATQVQAAEEE